MLFASAHTLKLKWPQLFLFCLKYDITVIRLDFTQDYPAEKFSTGPKMEKKKTLQNKLEVSNFIIIKAQTSNILIVLIPCG